MNSDGLRSLLALINAFLNTDANKKGPGWETSIPISAFTIEHAQALQAGIRMLSDHEKSRLTNNYRTMYGPAVWSSDDSGRHSDVYFQSVAETDGQISGVSLLHVSTFENLAPKETTLSFAMIAEVTIDDMEKAAKAVEGTEGQGVVACENCNGAGWFPDTDANMCTVCNGEGTRPRIQPQTGGLSVV